MVIFILRNHAKDNDITVMMNIIIVLSKNDKISQATAWTRIVIIMLQANAKEDNESYVIIILRPLLIRG